MPDSDRRFRPSRREILAAAGGLASLASVPAIARAAPSGEPIKIGVIAEMSTLPGVAIPNAAHMAVDEINAKGGVLGRPLQLVVYDDHISSTDAVRAFQRLASQDKAVAVIGTFVSEIALALEPWSGRLKLPFVVVGATSNNIAEEIHKNYDRYKYTFHGWLTSLFLGESMADSAREILVAQLHMKTCAIMSENAAWTSSLDAAELKFLPKAGLTVLDHIRFSPDTTDFTPIFDKLEAKKPDVIMTGLSHVGVVPIVQWAQAHMPIALYGINSQASSSAFWKDTHGAAEGTVAQTAAGPTTAVTAATVPFTNAYEKRFNVLPAYCGYTSYDAISVIAAAITAAKTTEPDKMVSALEATDREGTIGHIRFYGRNDRFTHAVQYGPRLVQGTYIQWQHAKMETIWPLKFATAKISYPSFVKLPA